MRCRTARRRVSDSLDGTLGARKSHGFERHLRRCAACCELREDFRTIIHDVRSLETPGPADRVWNNILARMDAAKTPPVRRAREKEKKRLPAFSFFTPRFRFALATAAALVIVVAGVFFGVRQIRSGGMLSADEATTYSLAKLEEAQKYYQKAIKALNEAVSAQGGTVDPEVADALQAGQQAVDTLVAVCEQAVGRDPRNIEARSALLVAYQQKIDLLNETISLGKTGRRMASVPTI